MSRIQRIKNAFITKGDRVEQQLVQHVDMKQEEIKSQIERDVQTNFKNEAMTLTSNTPPFDELDDYKYIFDNVSAGIWMRASMDGPFIYTSKGLEAILGIPTNTLYDNQEAWFKLVQRSYVEDVVNAKKRVVSGEKQQIFYGIHCPDGTEKWLLEQIIPRKDKNGTVTNVFGLVLDLTREVNLENELQYLESFDLLTGILNQAKMHEMMDQLIFEEEPFVIFQIDLDRFSMINNSLGYAIGDEVLKVIATRLKKMTPESGAVGRISGNLFLMIVRKYGRKSDTRNIADDIMKIVRQPIFIYGYEIHVTASIGITFFPEEGHDKRTLLEKTYYALQEAKKRGKNNYQYASAGANISTFRQYMLERDMRHSFEEQQFEIYYQPQLEPRKGTLLGAEALIRWIHPKWGVVLPEDFIPLAEENHFIVPLTDWVIEQVLASLQYWKLQGLVTKPIAINLSVLRLLKQGFIEFVDEKLKQYDIEPEMIAFEISQHSFLHEEDYIVKTLINLKKRGIGIVLEDFGTGYFSLDSLRKLKPNKVKIDKIFVQNIDALDGIDEVIVSSSIHLIKSLGMEVVIEGIETTVQLNFVKQKDCDIVQGFLFSKPVREETFIGMLRMGRLVPKSKSVKKVTVERRKYYRYTLPAPVEGFLRIIEYNRQPIHVGKTPVLIENISLGGLKFLSKLKLPVNEEMKFNVAFRINDEAFQLAAKLIWCNEEKMDLYSYGIQFMLDKDSEKRLSALMNKLSTHNNRVEPFLGTPFIYEPPYKYFEQFS